MKFPADECLHVEIKAMLRDAGHEVTTVAPLDSGATDEMVLERALRERAILLTAEKDFGEIALARASASPGIVLFRRLVTDPAGAAARLLVLIQEHGNSLHHLYVVITPARARVRRLDARRCSRP